MSPRGVSLVRIVPAFRTFRFMSMLRTSVSKQTDSTFSQDSSRVPEVSTSISRESKISDNLEGSNLEHPIADLKCQSSPSLNSKTATYGSC